MMKLSVLIILMLTAMRIISQPSVKHDIKIGKKEFEIGFMAGLSDRGALAGTQIIYRFPLPCQFKLGGGIHFSVDENKNGSHPGLLLDLAKFVGNKQKWKFSGQVGRAFYETSYSYSGINGATYFTKENKEKFFQLNSVYRMNISKKTSFFLGGYYLVQTYELFTEAKDGLGQTLNPIKSRRQDGGGGIRFGFVF